MEEDIYGASCWLEDENSLLHTSYVFGSRREEFPLGRQWQAVLHSSQCPHSSFPSFPTLN